MESEETVQGGIGHHKVTPNPLSQRLSDHRDRAEQRDDHLRSPVRHVAPGQQITEECLGHQSNIDHHAQQPNQFTRLAM